MGHEPADFTKLEGKILEECQSSGQDTRFREQAF